MSEEDIKDPKPDAVAETVMEPENADEVKSDPNEDLSKTVDDVESSDKAKEKKEETAADLLGANIEQVKVRKAKGSKKHSIWNMLYCCYFQQHESFFSDMSGNIISWSSSGKCNFRDRGSQRLTPPKLSPKMQVA